MNPTPRHVPARLCASALLGLISFVAAVEAETLVVANKAEASVSLIDLASGQVVATLPAGEGPHEVGISPDERFALVTNYGRRDAPGRSLTLIDIAAAEVVRNIDLGDYQRPHGVEWLDESRVAVTAEDDKALIVVDVETGEVVQKIGTDQEVSHMVALDRAGQRAYLTNIGSGSLTVLDLESGERERNIPTGEGAEGVAVSGTRIWVTNRGADSLTILDAGTLETVKEIPSEGFPIRATATPKGQILVTRARAGDMVIYDAVDMVEVRRVSFDLKSMDVEERLFGDRFGDSSVPIGVVVDNSGEHAFVAHANADVITEIDLASGEVVRTLRAGREPDGMGFSSHPAR
ncbi:MAG: cytochrome D1 domain-containing protein [Gammaproteobacteria bacterium]|jgi:YVTN family beta-propeller protein